MSSQDLGKKYFSEGIAQIGNHIYQLTWKENEVYKWEVQTPDVDNKFIETDLKFDKKLKMPEGSTLETGWGLTSIKCKDWSKRECEQLVATDGGDSLHFIDVKQWKEVKSIPITENG